MKKRLTTLKWLGLALAGVSAFVSSSAMANHMQAESKGGLKVFNPANEDYWFGIGGRINFDEAIFTGNTRNKGSDFPSGANIRRAFLKLNGGVGEFLTYNATFNFTGSNVFFEDVWLNYAGLYDGTNLRVGQFTPPTTIDDWGNYGTTNNTMFLESSQAITTFAKPQKGLGVWFDGSFADLFMLSAAAYQPRQAEVANNIALTNTSVTNFGNPNRSDRLGASARLTFSPVHTEDTVYHLGVLGRFQSMSNLNATGSPVFQANLFSTTPEARARNTSAFLLDTGAVRARSYNVVAGEAMAIWGPITVEGEYHQSNVQRVPTITDTTTSGNFRVHGWHVQGGYMLTGEARRYDFATGTLHSPRPIDKMGAWELVARYSTVKLNDGVKIQGGKGNNVTVGLNWFVHENVQVAFNYIRADIRPTNAAPVGTAVNAIGTVPGVGPGAIANPAQTKRQLDIFGLRVGVMF